MTTLKPNNEPEIHFEKYKQVLNQLELIYIDNVINERALLRLIGGVPTKGSDTQQLAKIQNQKEFLIQKIQVVRDMIELHGKDSKA